MSVETKLITLLKIKCCIKNRGLHIVQCYVTGNEKNH